VSDRRDFFSYLPVIPVDTKVSPTPSFYSAPSGRAFIRAGSFRTQRGDRYAPHHHGNGKTHDVDGDGDTPLLCVLRDVLGMTETKFGCGLVLCGAATASRVRSRWLRLC
jgi:hypothetical protein